MFWNIIWLAITNIKRNKSNTILYLIITFFISQILFLVGISRNLLRFTDISALNNFFYIIIYTVLFLALILLTIVVILFTRIRGQEYGILRIFGVKKSDILFLSALEMFFISCIGALAGIFFIILMVLTKILYLPYFFELKRKITLIRLIGVGGQTISGVIIIELIIACVAISLQLKNDIPQLLRGS